MPKYHVALSFAGEDRDYVEKVATQLRSNGVDVFYDGFEEADLWGKDLYAHLSNVYQNLAIFTVMFVSDAYSKKFWTNHERKSAQARALIDSHQEYILPAFFDESIEVPGLLKTTGHVALANRTPERFATLIVEKLKKSGVQLKQQFAYSDAAKADVDFSLTKGNPIAKIIKDLQTYNWYTQNPAVEKLLSLDWAKVSADETFVLGRNLYQCACGNERKAVSVMDDLRHELAALPDERALDLLNGMFFEAYFDSKGEFRSGKIKGRCLDKLLSIQTVKKFEPSIMFIRRALEPYRSELPFLPAIVPEVVTIELTVKRGAPPVVKALKVGDRSLLGANEDDSDLSSFVWRLSYQSFTVKDLTQRLADEWNIPVAQLAINCGQRLDPKAEIRLPEGMSVRWPART